MSIKGIILEATYGSFKIENHVDELYNIITIKIVQSVTILIMDYSYP